MLNSMNLEHQQPNLWQQSDNLIFADLCNALYERELKKLSNDTSLPHSNLLQVLGSLPHYVKRASERILSFGSPLDLDSHNASWTYRQPTECPAGKQSARDIEQFYAKVDARALVVPIWHESLLEEHITLDTIDGYRDGRIHTNENGWFNQDGSPASDGAEHIRLLKPTKVTMTCACSGHRWKNRKRAGARRLSLREMLLATNINWSNFAKVSSTRP